MWYDVLHTPSIHSREAWKGACLRVSLSKYPDQEDHLAGSRRATVTPEVKIVNGTKLMVESVLKEVSEGQVGRLVIDLYSIPTNTDAALLTQAVTKVEKCVIWGGQSGQLEAIFSAVRSKLKHLTVLECDLTAVTPEVFLGALRVLEKVSFGLTTFSTDQVTAILTMLTEGSQRKLEKLEIFHPNVEDEAYDLLEAAEENDILKIKL